MPESVPTSELLNQLDSLVKTRRVLPVKFAGQLFIADGYYALYWPAMQTLIVSDLHLGKAQSLNRHGNHLPEQDSLHTLQHLRGLINDYQPQRVIALGDSFHDVRTSKQLHAEVQASLSALTSSIPEWIWILGNHDMHLSQQWPGLYQQEWRSQGIRFLHEPVANSAPQIVGHFHPKYTAKVHGNKIKGRCFVVSERWLIMPSFGSFTGGMAHNHPELMAQFDSAPEKVLLCLQSQIFAFPA